MFIHKLYEQRGLGMSPIFFKQLFSIYVLSSNQRMSLPPELWRLIFAFDPTYHRIAHNAILRGFNLQVYPLPFNMPGCLHRSIYKDNLMDIWWDRVVEYGYLLFAQIDDSEWIIE